MYDRKFDTITEAIKKEKQLKRWKRDCKWKVIKESNPELIDLSKDRFDEKGELK